MKNDTFFTFENFIIRTSAILSSFLEPSVRPCTASNSAVVIKLSNCSCTTLTSPW